MITISSLIFHRFWNKVAVVMLMMAVVAAGIGPDSARAQDNGDNIYHIGMRVGNLFEVKDSPINSMPMVSFYVRRNLNSSLSAVLSLDSYVFDVEHTGRALGIATVEDASASGKMSSLTASLDYALLQDIHGFKPYVQAGIGLGFVDFDDEDNVSSTGAQYNIKTESKDDVEWVPTVSIGVRYATESRWFFDAGARCDYHLSNWEIKDRVSDRTVRIEDFYAIGAYLGVGIKL